MRGVRLRVSAARWQLGSLIGSLLGVSFLLVLWASVARPPAPKLRVPDGFVVERVAGPGQVRFPMFAAFDERGRLFVAESSGGDLYAELAAQKRRCRVRLLEDRDGDGRFETSRVFADKLVFPMGLAWRDGKLYVADPPDLVALEDTDGDGKADRRTVLLTGFGHIDNGSLHGLQFGPDGLLYMTMGSPDGYRLKRADGSVLRGESGALFRCRPDGSNPEVLARGFLNLVEVVFTPRGDAIGTDNWFQQPSGGVRDALVHLVDGGLYPYHPDAGTPQPVTGDPLPAAALFPAVALSGLALVEGPAFPNEMRGDLFSAQHNARRVGRHVVVAEGSTFKTRDSDFLTTDDPDFHPSDVLEDADGSLLVVDTGSWYIHHCPTGAIRNTQANGGIYRVRFARAAAVADPWGLKVKWDRAGPAELASLLADRRPAVRERARRTLAARGKDAVPVLARVLRDGKLLERQQAAWALSAVEDATALPPLRQALRDPNADMVVTAARALARRDDREAAPELGRLLAAKEPAVRLAAAEALARAGDARVLPDIWKALTDNPDRFLDHALVHAAHRLAGADPLEKALGHEHAAVRRAALLLLDQPPRPKDRLGPDVVLRQVSSSDAALRQTALSVLARRPEWGGKALGLLRGWLGKDRLSAEEAGGLRSLVLAFEARPDVQALVAESLSGAGKLPAERRVLLLEALAQSGLPRPPRSWVEAVREGMRSSQGTVRTQAVRTAVVLGAGGLRDELGRLAEDAKEPAALRMEAARGVVSPRERPTDSLFALLRGQLADRDQPLPRLSAAELLGRARLDDRQIRTVLRAVKGDALISPSVLLPALERARDEETAGAVLEYLTAAVRQGWKPPEAVLAKSIERLPAGVRARANELRKLLRREAGGRQARLEQLEPLLAGGHAERGREVFFGNKVACATCHRVGTAGGDVGPDLTKLGVVRSGRDILESVLFPSSTIAQGYETLSLTTKDGRVLTGVMSRQAGDMMLLRDSGGKEVRLRNDQVEEAGRPKTSLMPDGLERLLTQDEFRDLLAFLQQLK